MNIVLTPQSCREGQCLPLIPGEMGLAGCHILAAGSMPPLPAGCVLYPFAPFLAEEFQVCGHVWLPGAGGSPCVHAPMLRACHDIAGGAETKYTVNRHGYALAAVTLSDKGAAGQRQDESGPLMASLIGGTVKLALSQYFILPDEASALRGLLAELALGHGYDIICTSGGTGVGPRDITPEATQSLLDVTLPGITQAMLMTSLAKTARAVISRAVAGIIGKCLVINLPGSPKAVRECLEPILPALEHALAKIHGDPADCGG